MTDEAARKWLRERLLSSAGVFSIATADIKAVNTTLVELKAVEARLQALATDLRLTGQFRYATAHRDAETYDQRARRGLERSFVDRAIEKLRRYARSGNAELLADVHNYCVLECWRPMNPNHHYAHEDRHE